MHPKFKALIVFAIMATIVISLWYLARPSSTQAPVSPQNENFTENEMSRNERTN